MIWFLIYAVLGFVLLRVLVKLCANIQAIKEKFPKLKKEKKQKGDEFDLLEFDELEDIFEEEN